MARRLAALLLAGFLALPVAAQEPTLADLKAELYSLRDELQSLRGELVASGAAGFQAAGGDGAIDRMNAMEARLMQLTDRIEQLQNRVGRIVEDGTRRIGDIEFRLCEMDETCDLGALITPDLGGLAQGGGTVPQLSPVQPSARPARPSGAAATTAGEQADFDRASEALANGDFRTAAEMFGAVAETHAGGPLTAEALFLRGAALDSAGDPKAAASAWLEGFAAAPDGPRAAESLLGIARVIAADGDPMASCLYLAEIPARFPGSEPAAEAERRMTVMDCASAQLEGVAPNAALPEGADFGDLDPEAAADLTEHQ
ncbi:tetratricopeptide repeat protein [Paracoccus spongiarum]|uniref:Tetratricopeptide repeat protein n=1 Tax=Paracoccus spongiarum TaxID=3064387 RepID=A0ABT9JEX6_9RHOB|nr:tetratricopeptide repeat protein [Paracoccus sp. 2205BS29-5]MDP5307606.1 tetratricopeptide repeat protein [Paracoccus sp. 2205BS29-5]